MHPNRANIKTLRTMERIEAKLDKVMELYGMPSEAIEDEFHAKKPKAKPKVTKPHDQHEGTT